MKKFPALSLLLTIPCFLCGCQIGSTDDPVDPIDPVDPVDPTITYIQISMEGAFNKKHYSLSENWDPTGIRIFGKLPNGAKTLLQSNQYTLSFTPQYPRLYVNSLTVNAKLRTGSAEAMLIFTDLSVDSETYNFEQEKAEYYSNVVLTSTGDTLRNTLHGFTWSKHTTHVYYKDVASYKQKNSLHDSTDAIPNASKMELFFTGTRTDFSAGNREHIWPAANSSSLWDHSKLDNTNYVGGGSDLYHVRPTNEEVNSAHGNGKYVDFDDSTHKNKKSQTKLIGDGKGPYSLRCYGLDRNNQYADYVECDDGMKGDLARIIAYVYMHYSTYGNITSTPSSFRGYTAKLQLNQVLGYSESECKKKLIEWNNLDPVSEVEKYRNHTIQKIQGNRNPFVDDPTLMQKVFGY